LVEEKSKATEIIMIDMLLSAKYEDGSKMDENQLVDEILILFAVMKQLQMHLLTCELLARNPAQSKNSI
jgi:cytochrome P450